MWKEAEVIESLKDYKSIDESYYIRLVDEAIDTIKQYGDFEWFVGDFERSKDEPFIISDPLPDGWDELCKK